MIDLEIGDHIISSRGLYAHHGIYVGGRRIVHYAGLGNGIHDGPVEEVAFELFLNKRDFRVRKYSKRKWSRVEAVARARSRIGENLYNVFNNNCEHFVEWCINGNHHSDQIDNGTAAGGAAAGGVSAAAGVGTIASAGAVAGLSGPGIMSGLASVGGVVGGGAVAGLAIVAAAPATLTALVVNSTVLSDNDAHDQDEKTARQIGRVGSYAGAAAGTAGSVAAVSALGSVSGLSAAGITSGLAALGTSTGAASIASTVGLSAMTGGVAIAVAGPVVAAAAVGYGIYKVTKLIKG